MNYVASALIIALLAGGAALLWVHFWRQRLAIKNDIADFAFRRAMNELQMAMVRGQIKMQETLQALHEKHSKLDAEGEDWKGQ